MRARMRAVPGCAVGSLTLRDRWQLFDAHMSALASAAFAALIDERVRHLRHPLWQRSCAHSFRLSGPHPAPQSAHRRMLRLCACERPCEVTAAAQVHAVSPLTISALRRAIAAEPSYARALQLPQATAVAVPT
jgi:hypothetical protein